VCNSEEVDALQVTRIVSQTRCTQPILVPPSANTERVGERASEIAVHRGTLVQVCGRSGFWEAYSRLLASSARPAPLRFFVDDDAVRGTASTSYDYIEHTHEISRVNDSTNALSIGPSEGYFLISILVHVSFIFTAYVSSNTHIHINVITYIALVLWIKLKFIMINFLREATMTWMSSTTRMGIARHLPWCG
jgi:hypothetical protein